jgi:hypothetical protein
MRVRPDITRLSDGSRRSRGRRRLAVFAASVAITTMSAFLSAGGAAAAPAAPLIPDTPNVTIFLKNSPSFCADIKNDNNHAGATIWLYKCSQSKSDHWYEIDGVDCGTTGQFICSYFIDVQNYGANSVCLGMTGARNVVLQTCGNNGNEYLTSELWIQDTGSENGWRNYNWGPSGDLAVASNTATDPLFGVDAGGGGGCQCWYRWSDS